MTLTAYSHVCPGNSISVICALDSCPGPFFYFIPHIGFPRHTSRHCHLQCPLTVLHVLYFCANPLFHCLFHPLSVCLFCIRVWYLSRYTSTLIVTAVLHGTSLIFTSCLFFPLPLSIATVITGVTMGYIFTQPTKSTKTSFYVFLLRFIFVSIRILSQVICLACSPPS